MAPDRSTASSLSSFLLLTVPTASRTVARQSHYGPTLTRLLSACFILHSLIIILRSTTTSSSFFAEAIQCTYPRYNTQLQPGQNAVLSWQVSGSDLTTYDSLTATLYCMDINGPRGGIWRNVATLFQNKGLVAAQEQFQFSVPYCGQLARDVAIRIIARGNGVSTTGMSNDACYFMMKPAVVDPPPVTTTTAAPIVVVTPNPPPPPPPPPSSIQTTTTGPKQPTVSPPGTGTMTPPTATNPSSSPSSPMPLVVSGSISIDSSLPSGRPYPYIPLPPLPPIPDDDSGSPRSSGNNGPDNRPQRGKSNIITILGSLCGGAALVTVVSLIVMRRRQTRRNRHGRGFVNSSDAFGGGSKLEKGMRKRIRRLQEDGVFKSLTRGGAGQNEGRFHLMMDEDNEDEQYDDKTMPQRDAMFTESQQTREEGPTIQDNAREEGQTEDLNECRSSALSYPEYVYLDPTWRRHSTLPPLSYTDKEYDYYTMSSVRSTSSWETSSVVRKYWAASIAARTERRLEGFPPSRDFFDERSLVEGQHSPSCSSLSRKADILTLDSASFSSSYSSLSTRSLSDNTSAETTRQEGPVRIYFRNTLNSINEYLRRSMSMGLSSLRSTVPSSDDESWNPYYNRQGRAKRGFRCPINTEFLDNLNVKPLQNEQLQLEYYAHHYRQYPMSTVSNAAYETDRTGISGASRTSRTSSVPSLTSTNDPFKTFDSNEVLVDLGPFSDEYASPLIEPDQVPIIIATAKDTVLYSPPTLITDERSNSALLRSFPTPPITTNSDSESASSLSSLELPVPLLKP